MHLPNSKWGGGGRGRGAKHKKMGNFQFFQDTAWGRRPIIVCVPEGLWGAATAPGRGLGKDGDRAWGHGPMGARSAREMDSARRRGRGLRDMGWRRLR